MPDLITGDYSTSISVPVVAGAPHSYNQGGICNYSTPAAHCLFIPGGDQGTPAVTGLIPFTAAASGAQWYETFIQVGDQSSTKGSYYEITIDGTLIGSTPTVTVGGTIASVGTFGAYFSDGISPGVHEFAVTNGYFANTATPIFSGAENSIVVSQIDIPLQPPTILVGNPTTTTLEVTWTPPVAPGTVVWDITSYTLRYRVDPSGAWTTVTGLTGSSYTVTGLSPSTTYDFEMESLTAVETSAFSAEAVGTTMSPPASGGGGTLCGWRGLSGINWKGMALVGDKFSNVIGLSDFSVFTEYTNSMRMLITSPPIHEDRKRIFVPRFEIEVEAGLGLPTAPETGPIMMLDISKDGGVTWQSLRKFRSMGAVGEYRTRLRWLALGNARQWVFRLQYSDAARPSLIGTYLDLYKGLG
jgi:Fibronectin type III domain